MDDYTNNKFTGNFQEHVNDHKEAISYPDMTSQTKERIECHWQNFFAISAIFRMFFLVIKTQNKNLLVVKYQALN